MNDKDTYRMHTKVIQIGDRKIGGGNPIAISTDAGGGSSYPGDQEADPHSFSSGYPF